MTPSLADELEALCDAADFERWPKDCSCGLSKDEEHPYTCEIYRFSWAWIHSRAKLRDILLDSDGELLGLRLFRSYAALLRAVEVIYEADSKAAQTINAALAQAREALGKEATG